MIRSPANRSETMISIIDSYISIDVFIIGAIINIDIYITET